MLLYFERSEFLFATSQKKDLCVCSTNLGLSGEKKLCVCSTNLGFSVGYVLCTRYVCTTLYDTRYVLCTRYVWYQVRSMYQIRMYHTCRCTINSTAVSLFVYSLVGYLRSAQETAVSLFVYLLVGGGITRTFRPWTHTSDDSYIYQLSLVLATATVSLYHIKKMTPESWGWYICEYCTHVTENNNSTPQEYSCGLLLLIAEVCSFATQ